MIRLISIVCLFILLAACTAGVNPAEKTPGQDGKIAGFWLGLWHGLIAPITFIVSLFEDNIHFYESHNNGHWYNLGFLLGISAVFTGKAISCTTCRRRG